MNLVLLHAFPLHSGMWDAQREALQPYCTLLTPDFPGFGKASLIDATEWTIPAMAQLVLHQLNEYNIERCVIGGLSMGGYVAFECWRLFPERIEGLILADTMASPDTAETRRGRYVAIGQLRNGGYQKFAEGMIPRMVSEATKNERMEVMRQIGKFYQQAQPASVIAALGALAHRNDSRPILASITVPTAVIVGADDAVTKVEDAQLIADTIPNANLAILPTAGHLSNLEVPGDFNKQLIKFLQTLR